MSETLENELEKPALVGIVDCCVNDDGFLYFYSYILPLTTLKHKISNFGSLRSVLKYDVDLNDEDDMHPLENYQQACGKFGLYGEHELKDIFKLKDLFKGIPEEQDSVVLPDAYIFYVSEPTKSSLFTLNSNDDEDDEMESVIVLNDCFFTLAGDDYSAQVLAELQSI